MPHCLLVRQKDDPAKQPRVGGGRLRLRSPPAAAPASSIREGNPLLRLSDENLATLRRPPRRSIPAIADPFSRLSPSPARSPHQSRQRRIFIGPVAPSLLVSGLPALTRIPRTRSTGCRKQTCASDVQAMFPTPSPPAEKTSARQDQAGQASTRDRSGHGRKSDRTSKAKIPIGIK
jgi:hypothetical protein